MILRTICLAVALSAFVTSVSQGAAALGIDTKEWVNPNPEVVAQVEAMETAMAAMAKGEVPAVTLQQAIDKIRDLADNGNDKDALFSMGFLSQQSQGQNALSEAMKYYKRAADLGQLQAMNNYGFLLANSSQDAEKAKEGLDFIKQAAEGGLNAARRNMATIYLSGLGGEERNVDAAEKLLTEAAGSGDNQAQFELSQFYLETGGEAKTDDEKAWTLLNQAADDGNPNALATLGSILFDGKKFGARQIDANPALAVEKFTKLAEQNVPVGLRTMGELYANGLAGVEKNFPKAFDYFTRAAQGNDPAAQVVLAGYYDRGVDVDPNDGKLDVAPNAAAALELYRLAARNGVPVALYNVGTFYEEGRAVDSDANKAFANFLEAAGRGFAPAMQKAGVYYLNGVGTLRDAIAAAAWFTRSSAAGLPEGMLSLGSMAESGLVGVPAGTNPAKVAAEMYEKIIAAPQVNDPTRFEALARLSSIYFRGALADPGQTPTPDYDMAYKLIKRANTLIPANQTGANMLTEAAGKLTPEKIAALDAEAAQEDAALKAATPQTATPAAPADAPATPRAEPAPGQ